MQTVAQRQKLERQIVESFIDELLGQGFLLNINNGGEADEFAPTSDPATLKQGIMATDDERIYVYRGTEKRQYGWAYFVYGNDGWDVLCDYTLTIEPLMPKTLALIEQLSA